MRKTLVHKKLLKCLVNKPSWLWQLLTNPVDDGTCRRITNLPKESKQVLEQTTKAQIGEEFVSLCKWVHYFFF